MSGKHRRPEADALPDADVAGQMVPGPVIEATASALSGPTVIARRSRQSQRQARRRSQRRQVALIGGAALAVLIAIVGGWWLLAGRDGGDRDRAQTNQPKQRTVLIQVAGPDGTAQASALLGVRTDEDRAAAVLVPSRLIVDIAGSGAVSFGETLGLPDQSAPGKALTDLIGVSVNGGWVLSQPGLAALVDAVGGVPAEVDVDVVTTDAEGAETVVVRAGSQQLAGPAAAAYAIYAAAGEPEQSRLARFNDVLDGVLRGLPDEQREIEEAVAALADGSRSTLSRSELAQVLAGAHAVAVKDNLLSDVLPVNPIETGSGEESYGINAPQAAALMQSRFAPSLVQGSDLEAIRVLVQNGVGTPGLVDKARTRLIDAGFRFVNGGNAQPFDQEVTLVAIPDTSPASVERGGKVAAALGLPADAVGVSGQGQTVAEVIVVLGSDFRP